MDLLRPIKAFDAFQQERSWLAIPMAVFRKFADDKAGSLAALVAYYAFVSLFPLLLVLTTILGFVLQHNPGVQHSVEKSVLAQFPVIGKEIKLHSLNGRVSSLVIGLLASLLGGLGVTIAAQNAFDRLWAVPYKDRPNFVSSRLRGLGLITALATVFVGATVLTALTSGIHGPAGKVAAIAGGLVINLALFTVAFRSLTAANVPTRSLWVGALVGAVFWDALQFLVGLYINHVVRHASPVGGGFALVLGLLVWLHLGAQVTIYAAELNVVLARKLYPRSLLGPPDEPADEATLRALAKIEERHETEQVDVRFDA